jgi:RNA polymerase sigma-70 factor (ECF subfamily)
MLSFGDAYDDHVWDVYGFLAYRTGNRADAEDLTQLTFERALRAWNRFDPSRASVKTWLLTIARNLLVDEHRRTRLSPVRTTLDELGAREPSAEDRYELGLDPQLAAALAQLSARDREILALRFGADLEGAAIAELMDLSLAAVQQALSRTLRRLRDTLDGERPGAADAERAEGQQHGA